MSVSMVDLCLPMFLNNNKQMKLMRVQLEKQFVVGYYRNTGTIVLNNQGSTERECGPTTLKTLHNEVPLVNAQAYYPYVVSLHSSTSSNHIQVYHVLDEIRHTISLEERCTVCMVTEEYFVVTFSTPYIGSHIFKLNKKGTSPRNEPFTLYKTIQLTRFTYSPCLNLSKIGANYVIFGNSVECEIWGMEDGDCKFRFELKKPSSISPPSSPSGSEKLSMSDTDREEKTEVVSTSESTSTEPSTSSQLSDSTQQSTASPRSPNSTARSRPISTSSRSPSISFPSSPLLLDSTLCLEVPPPSSSSSSSREVSPPSRKVESSGSFLAIKFFDDLCVTATAEELFLWSNSDVTQITIKTTASAIYILKDHLFIGDIKGNISVYSKAKSSKLYDIYINEIASTQLSFTQQIKYRARDILPLSSDFFLVSFESGSLSVWSSVDKSKKAIIELKVEGIVAKMNRSTDDSIVFLINSKYNPSSQEVLDEAKIFIGVMDGPSINSLVKHAMSVLAEQRERGESIPVKNFLRDEANRCPTKTTRFFGDEVTGNESSLAIAQQPLHVRSIKMKKLLGHTVVPPAVQPLQRGQEYSQLKVRRFFGEDPSQTSNGRPQSNTLDTLEEPSDLIQSTTGKKSPKLKQRSKSSHSLKSSLNHSEKEPNDTLSFACRTPVLGNSLASSKNTLSSSSKSPPLPLSNSFNNSKGSFSRSTSRKSSRRKSKKLTSNQDRDIPTHTQSIPSSLEAPPARQPTPLYPSEHKEKRRRRRSTKEVMFAALDLADLKC